MYADDELLPLSGLQHIAYCERQGALIHLEQIWDESYDTVRGSLFHERVHLEGYSAAKGVRSERGYRLVSRSLGIAGIADVVEFAADGDAAKAVVRPVEYKVGKPKIEEWDRIQVCAQALCLEEMLGCAVGQGDLFYGATRRRERVVLDDALRERVAGLALRMHELFERGETPRAVRGSKCRRCSLADSCLPEAFDHDAVAYWKEAGFEKASQHALCDEL